MENFLFLFQNLEYYNKKLLLFLILFSLYYIKFLIQCIKKYNSQWISDKLIMVFFLLDSLIASNNLA